MIVAKRKPFEEIMGLIQDCKKVLTVGCGRNFMFRSSGLTAVQWILGNRIECSVCAILLAAC